MIFLARCTTSPRYVCFSKERKFAQAQPGFWTRPPPRHCHLPTGFWDGRDWKALSTTPAPQFRYNHATTYDSARHAVPLFGGNFNFNNGYYPNTNDTWELIAIDVPLINDPPASQYRQLNETTTFSVTAEGPPGLALKYQWYRDNVPWTAKATSPVQRPRR